MIVDNSAVVRGLVSRWIDEEPGLEVVSRHANGKLAVDDVARSAPDIVLLDIEMPVMDGLEALPLLLQARPELRVLMVSTLTRRNAEISFKALALGALDYVPKPDSNREITTSLDFRREVIRKIKSLGRVRTRRAVLRRGRPGCRRPCRRCRGRQTARLQAAPLFAGAAAHHCHRQLDRRPGGAGSRARGRVPVAIPGSGLGRAAYAAGLHRRSWPSAWRGPPDARPRKAFTAKRSSRARSMWRRATIT